MVRPEALRSSSCLFVLPTVTHNIIAGVFAAGTYGCPAPREAAIAGFASSASFREIENCIHRSPVQI